MRAVYHSTMGGFFYHLCGQSNDDRLHAITLNQQVFGPYDGPVGRRQALLLRAGPQQDSPLIAAAADEKLGTNCGVVRAPNTDLILFDKTGNEATKSVMMPAVFHDDTVTFIFSSRLRGNPDAERQWFAWVRVGKGSPTPFERGGWRLVRIDDIQFNSPTNTPERASEELNSAETLAIVVRAKGWLRQLFHDNPHSYTLQFGPGALSQNFDHHWGRLVVVSAAKLHLMKIMGETNEKSLRAAE